MTEKLQEIIKEEINKLPPESQKVINSFDWVRIVEEIGKKYSLNESDINDIQTETLLVLTGMEDPDLFSLNIEDEIGMLKEEAEKISAEIIEKVFTPIADHVGSLPAEKIEASPDDRLKQLPSSIRQAVLESDYQSQLYNISREHKLNVEQMGTLENLLVDVILGTLATEKFEDAVKSKLGLEVDKAGELVKAVNDRVLKKIREKMMAQNAPGEQTIEHHETKILNSAGIKIIDPNAPPAPPAAPVDLSIPELPPPPKADLPPTEAPSVMIMPEVKAETPPAPPLFNQKFADTFKVDTVKTEHTAPNPNSPNVSGIKPKTSYPKGQDPYRAAPE